jgi:hypothetical protein
MVTPPGVDNGLVGKRRRAGGLDDFASAVDAPANNERSAVVDDEPVVADVVGDGIRPDVNGAIC